MNNKQIWMLHINKSFTLTKNKIYAKIESTILMSYKQIRKTLNKWLKHNI